MSIYILLTKDLTNSTLLIPTASRQKACFSQDVFLLVGQKSQAFKIMPTQVSGHIHDAGVCLTTNHILIVTLPLGRLIKKQ